MRAWTERRRTAPVHALLDRAAAFVLRPPEPDGEPPLAEPGPELGHRSVERRGLAPAPPPDRPAAPHLRLVPGEAPSDQPDPFDPLRPVVAVVGLAPRAGASTVARALAARLARFSLDHAALLFSDDVPRIGFATAGARRLAREVSAFGCEGWRATGRVCVVPLREPLAEWAADPPAPLVADLGHGPPPAGALALAGHVVLVGPEEVEPALAGAVESSLRSEGHGVSLVLNRAPSDPPAELERALVLPEAQLAARLGRACREPCGPLAAVATELAERSLAEVL